MSNLTKNDLYTIARELRGGAIKWANIAYEARAGVRNASPEGADLLVKECKEALAKVEALLAMDS